MAGGSLTITANNYRYVQAIARRVLCQVTEANRGLVKSTTGPNGVLAIVIPEAIFPANLVLKPGGTDFLSGYVAGTNISTNVGNGAPANGVLPFTGSGACTGDTNRIIINSFAVNVGGNPKAITMDYTNGTGLGTVNVDWGDGTSTLGAAETAAALAHTYPDVGVYTVVIRDASAPVDATAATAAVVAG